MNATESLTGLPLAILISAALCTAPVAFIFIVSYRRTVIRLMSKRSRPDLERAESTKVAALPPSNPPTKLEFAAYDGTLSAKDSTLYRHLLVQRWQAAAIYVLGGLCFASFLVIVFFRASGIALSPWRFIVFAWAYFWPAILVVNLIASSNWRTGLIIVAAYFVVGAIVGYLGFENRPLGQIIFLWVNENAAPTILLLLFLNRRVRAVGPLLFTLMLFAVTGIALAIYAANMWIDHAVQAGTLGRILIAPFLHLPDPLFPLLVIGAGFLTVGLLGWVFLHFLKMLYIYDRLNEHTLSVDPIWLIFAFFSAVGLVFQNPWWIFSSLSAFLIYKIVMWGSFVWFNRSHKKRPGLKLLILRVFSLGARSEGLYDAAAKAWRYVGNIRFITGPDLATATIEPHNFLDFLSGKLSRHFIDSPGTLEQQLSAANVFPARDGRYAIHDYFCHDDTWKMVLSRLAEDSDAILMDLRNFSRRNAGCIFEINELVNYVPLSRVVFVVDKTTDEAFLRECIEEAWGNMKIGSPNFNNGARMRLLNYSSTKTEDYNRLLHAVAVAAQPG